MSVLNQIAESTRKRIAEAKVQTPATMLEAEITRTPADFTGAFLMDDLNVIAEVKLASPSKGDIAPELDPVQVAGDYLANGAAALSVLTEPNYFKGSLEYLRQIREAYPDAKILMKDFLLDEYQLLQARAAGADAVLIIIAMLGKARSKELLDAATEQGLTALVEVHDEAEMQAALEIGAKLVGVNNRDLKTLNTSLETSSRLITMAPNDVTMICESGLEETGQLQHFAGIGYKGFLVGTSLMATGKPGAALAALLGGGHES